MSETTPPDIQDLIWQIARYCQARLREKFRPISNPKASPPTSFSLDLVADCEQITNVVAKAFKNRRKHFTENINSPLTLYDADQLNWTIADYSQHLSTRQDGSNQKREMELLEQFPPQFQASPQSTLPYENDAATIDDQDGVILMWYLPNALSSRRQVRET